MVPSVHLVIFCSYANTCLLLHVKPYGDGQQADKTWVLRLFAPVDIIRLYVATNQTANGCMEADVSCDGISHNKANKKHKLVKRDSAVQTGVQHYGCIYGEDKDCR